MIEVFDPVNPENTFGAFTHGDFSAAGAVTDGPTSLILDIQDSDGSNGVFGGIGVDYGIFLQEHPGRRDLIAWHAVTLSAVSTLLSFGLLSLSNTPASITLNTFGP